MGYRDDFSWRESVTDTLDSLAGYTDELNYWTINRKLFREDKEEHKKWAKGVNKRTKKGKYRG